MRHSPFADFYDVDKKLLDYCDEEKPLDHEGALKRERHALRPYPYLADGEKSTCAQRIADGYASKSSELFASLLIMPILLPFAIIASMIIRLRLLKLGE